MRPVSDNRNRKISGAIAQLDRMSPSGAVLLSAAACATGPHLERVRVGSFVVEQPARSRGAWSGAVLGDELSALVGGEGQRLAHAIDQGVQITVRQPVEAIAAAPRRIEAHECLVPLVQRVQRANA